MGKVQSLVGSLLLLVFFPLLAKPVLEITIPTSLVHLNPAASSTITFTVKNVSGAPLMAISIPQRQIVNSIFSATVESTTCSGTLANNASCEVVLNVAGRKDGQASLSPEVCAFAGAVCSHGTLQVTVNNVEQQPPVTSLAATLPANVEVGVAYPIVATFQNPNEQYPMTGVTIAKNPANCVKTADTCQGGILAPQAACQVSYLFTPPTAGSYHLSGTFHYNEGADILNQKTVLATQAAVAGTVVTPLPANIEQDRSYPVVFQYTNFGTAALNYPAVTPPAGLSDVVNTCTGGTLASHANCAVSGHYTAGTPGSKVLTAILTPSGPGTINPVTLMTTSLATDVAIIGTVNPALPNTLTPGVSYPVVFTFTNPNATLSAQQVTLDKLLPNFTQTSDSCGTTLAPGASCAIGGDFQTSTEGPVALSVIFDHDNNASVPLTTTSMASQATLVGTVTGFPANVETNIPQPVTFTFANHGSADATINSTTLTFPNSVGTVTNQCTDNLVLAPGQACTISGTLQNATTGPITWSATVNYRGGPANANIDVTQNTSTNVSDTVVTGNVVTAVPAHVTTNMARNFVFTFTNNGSLSATDIKVVKSLPYTSNVSDNCGNTLPGGTNCTIQGTFDANFTGPQALSVTLTYKEGASVALNNTTMVTGSLVQAANINASTSYTSPNMNQYSLDGSKRAGFVILPELQTNSVSGAPTGLIWRSTTPSNFNVQLTRTQDSQLYSVNFNGQRNNACNAYSMNSAVSCSSPGVGVLRLSNGNNTALPSGTYTGQLIVSMQDWISTYRQMLILNITYTK